MSAPTRPDWGSSVCGCGCRPEPQVPGRCPCKQCQPGPGIDFGVRRASTRRAIVGRMGYLLAQHELTPDESAELDDLLEEYLHG